MNTSGNNDNNGNNELNTSNEDFDAASNENSTAGENKEIFQIKKRTPKEEKREYKQKKASVEDTIDSNNMIIRSKEASRMVSRKNSHKSHKVLTTVFVIILIAALGVGGGYIYMQKIQQPFSTDRNIQIAVVIDKGSSTTKIGKALEESKLISDASHFKFLSRVRGNDGKYKAGSYVLSPSMTMDEIMEVLIEGKQETISFTIPEGYTLEQIADKVAETGVCNKEEFLLETRTGSYGYWFINQIPDGEKRLEGFLYPDTYEIYKQESAHNVIDKMLGQFEKVYNKAIEDTGVEPAYTITEIVTIASLVEREAKLDEERPIVSSVIYNRLNIGMKLQIDATVQYALGQQKDRLLYSDLEIDSPYNTYKVDALPAGPICSPGRASIEAALAPAATDYLYYVASAAGDGSHNFATNGNDFESYKKDYIATLN